MDGDREGSLVEGEMEGPPVGARVGPALGKSVGLLVGDNVGFSEGSDVVGLAVGVAVGSSVVGDNVGLALGAAVGLCVLHTPHVTGHMNWYSGRVLPSSNVTTELLHTLTTRPSFGSVPNPS